jgi:hypothetical protein
MVRRVGPSLVKPSIGRRLSYLVMGLLCLFLELRFSSRPDPPAPHARRGLATSSGFVWPDVRNDQPAQSQGGVVVVGCSGSTSDLYSWYNPEVKK